MVHGSLFSGIGGFDLAAEWMGWENAFHCEYNEFGQQKLHYYWPNAMSYKDIKNADFTIWRDKIDILTGGFPCQPYSLSGQRKGTEDDRHLWPQMLETIRTIEPRWVVAENVHGLFNWSGGLVFEQICNDLECEGYEVQSLILPAGAIGADHRRDRVFFVGYSQQIRRVHFQSETRNGDEKTNHTKGRRTESQWRKQKANELDPQGNTFLQFEAMFSEPPIYDVADGIPFGMDEQTFKSWAQGTIEAAGNAVHPELIFEIFQAIEETDGVL